MPDIQMCHGYKCPLKKNCHRFTRIEDEDGQSYLTGSPYDSENLTCEQYWHKP